MTIPVRPAATSRPGALILTDSNLFGPGHTARTKLFARRVLTVTELSALELDPTLATATLRYRTPPSGEAAMVGRLADAAASGNGLDEARLPPWRLGEPVVLYRHGDLISTFKLLSLSGGRLQVSHPAIRLEPERARRIGEALGAVPGVLEVLPSIPVAGLEVRFDPALANGPALLRLAETALLDLPARSAVTGADRPRSTGPGVTLGVAAAGEFVAPVLLPVSAALLVWNSLGTLRAGAEELRNGKPGLPALYSSVVVFTLLSGSLFSAALMYWFLHYWERRHRSEMAEESTALFAQIRAVPGLARVVRSDGAEHLVPSGEVEAGQHVRVVAGDTTPVDGRVVAGTGLVDESVLAGSVRRAARMPRDEMLAGTPLLAGEIELWALRSGRQSYVAQLGRAVTASAMPTRSRWTLTEHAEALAARAVPFTWAVAAVGLFTGGPGAANAIVRSDIATGFGLSRPLRTLSLNWVALRHGALVRTHHALDHLANGIWVMLDDYERLADAECELAECRTRGIPEDQLFPAIAAAGAWLGDARGPALIRANAARGLIGRAAALRNVDEQGVAIDYGGHVVRLCGGRDRAALPPLRVEVDGIEVAGLTFHHNGRVPAASTVSELQRAGLRVLLASGRADEDAADIARRIGADAYVGMLDDHARCHLLGILHERGVAVLHVRDGAALPHARDDYLSIGLAGPDGIRHDADIALLDRSIAPLPVLIKLARETVAACREDRWTIVAPNIAAVAGVFAFGMTGLAVVLISNLATYVVHERARRTLAMVKANPSVIADPPWSAGDVDGLGWPGPKAAEAVKPKKMRVYV